MSKNVLLENCKITFRNFSGKEGRFNPPGKRNFCVLLDPEKGDELKEDGWNVRYLPPRDAGEEPQAYLPVAVSFDVMPPKIVLITSSGKTQLDESTISSLDWAEIEMVDLMIRPYDWEVNGRVGRKAYVKSMWVTIFEDELEKKYQMMDEEGPF